jgi:hypothetical protein
LRGITNTISLAGDESDNDARFQKLVKNAMAVSRRFSTAGGFVNSDYAYIVYRQRLHYNRLFIHQCDWL